MPRATSLLRPALVRGLDACRTQRPDVDILYAAERRRHSHREPHERSFTPPSRSHACRAGGGRRRQRRAGRRRGATRPGLSSSSRRPGSSRALGLRGAGRLGGAREPKGATPCRVAEGLGVSRGRRGLRGGDAGVHRGPDRGVRGARGRLVSSTRLERKTERVRLGGRVSVLQRSSPPRLYRVSAGLTRCPMRVASFRRARDSSAQRGPRDCSPQLWPEPGADADVRGGLRRPRAGRLRMSRAECHVLT